MHGGGSGNTRGLGGATGGPWRAPIHPLRQDGNLLPGQLLRGRHLEVFILVADRFEEQALRWVGEKDRGAGIAAFEQAGAGGEAKSAFDLRFSAVAFETRAFEDGPDL